ncbi:MAG TPA: hypothetical protein VJH24_03680 [Candidatus Bilamarchaeaceae archaeon]|nr:hypothetical protein [Candidatus Bilamarchaeaceae archaeon]
MIIGGKVTGVEVKKNVERVPRTFNFDIKLKDVETNGEEVEVTYYYTVQYENNAGHIRMEGVLVTKEKEEMVRSIQSEWKKTKTLPPAYAEMILSAITYGGGSNGTLLATVVNLPPPLMPPRIQVGKEQ